MIVGTYFTATGWPCQHVTDAGPCPNQPTEAIVLTGGGTVRLCQPCAEALKR